MESIAMTQEVHDRFIKDVRGHKMDIQLDQDCHRHLHFSRNGSLALHYNIVTWPGYLAISGDMGSYTFSRTRDMFEFFRDREMLTRINPQYWNEKLDSIDKHSSPKEFSEAAMMSAIRNHINKWEVTIDSAKKIEDEVHQEFTGWDGPTNLQEAYRKIHEFESSEGHVFQDFESSMTEWSFHYLWALKAIVWAIKQYDLEKEGRTQAHVDARILRGEI